jgi:hypothetical protein
MSASNLPPLNNGNNGGGLNQPTNQNTNQVYSQPSNLPPLGSDPTDNGINSSNSNIDTNKGNGLNTKLLIIVGLLFVVLLPVLIIAVLYFKDQNISIIDPTITNITDTGFTVTWVSNDPYIGRVVYQESGGGWPVVFAQNGKPMAYDDRDVKLTQEGTYVQKENGIIPRYTHHVTIRNVKPATTYDLRVAGTINGKEIPLIITTREIIEDINTPNPAYGKVEGANNNDSIIIFSYVTPESGLDLISIPVSKNGTYSFDTNLMKEDLIGSDLVAIIKTEDKKVEDYRFTSEGYKPLENILLDMKKDSMSTREAGIISKISAECENGYWCGGCFNKCVEMHEFEGLGGCNALIEAKCNNSDSQSSNDDHGFTSGQSPTQQETSGPPPGQSQQKSPPSSSKTIYCTEDSRIGCKVTGVNCAQGIQWQGSLGCYNCQGGGIGIKVADNCSDQSVNDTGPQYEDESPNIPTSGTEPDEQQEPKYGDDSCQGIPHDLMDKRIDNDRSLRIGQDYGTCVRYKKMMFYCKGEYEKVPGRNLCGKTPKDSPTKIKNQQNEREAKALKEKLGVSDDTENTCGGRSNLIDGNFSNRAQLIPGRNYLCCKKNGKEMCYCLGHYKASNNSCVMSSSFTRPVITLGSGGVDDGEELVPVSPPESPGDGPGGGEIDLNSNSVDRESTYNFKIIAQSPASREAVLGASNNRDGLEVSESGRYVFFSDGEKIAEKDIVVNNGSMDVKMYFDDNGNGVKDAQEQYVGDYTSITLAKDATVETYTLSSGWNLIHIPMIDQRTENPIKTAGDLIDYWRGQQANILHIARFREGKFEMYTKRETGTEYDSTDFDINPGDGLFVMNMGDNVEVTFSGNKLEDSFPLNLVNGWNLVGIISSDKNYNSEELLKAIGSQGVSADTISQFENGIYQSVIYEDSTLFGNNFNVIDKKGYFIRIQDGGGNKFIP